MNITESLKIIAKKWRDNLYSKNILGKEAVGVEDQWTVLTKILEAPIVYSGGAGKHITFETTLIEQYQATVYLFDPSPTGIQTISRHSLMKELHFYPVALSGEDGKLTMFTPVRPEEGSYTMDVQQTGQSTISFPCRKISSLMEEYGHKRIDILKLDIEGFEYDVLNSILNDKIEVSQICVEFHHFFKTISKKQTEKMIKRLKEAGYILYHKHELDYSFCHKRLLGYPNRRNYKYMSVIILPIILKFTLLTGC